MSNYQIRPFFAIQMLRVATIVFLFFSYLNVNGQTVAQTVKDIRKKFQIINATKGYKTVTIDYETLNTLTGIEVHDGAEVTGYLKDKKLHKMVYSAFHSNMKETIEYYYWDGKPIFIYQRLEQPTYDTVTTSLDFTKTTLQFECRIYCKNGKVVQILKSGDPLYYETEATTQKVGKPVITPVILEKELLKNL